MRKAFKKLTRQFHPDKQQGKTDEEKQEAEEKFKEINEAYQVLSDPRKRNQVDQGVYDPDGSGGGAHHFSQDQFA